MSCSLLSSLIFNNNLNILNIVVLHSLIILMSAIIFSLFYGWSLMVPCSCESLDLYCEPFIVLAYICVTSLVRFEIDIIKDDLHVFMTFSFVWHIQLKFTLNLILNLRVVAYKAWIWAKTHLKAGLGFQFLRVGFSSSSRVITKTGKYSYLLF